MHLELCFAGASERPQPRSRSLSPVDVGRQKKFVDAFPRQLSSR